MATTTASGTGTGTGGLKRDVGFWGLMFVSLGSIIGSGWLLGALTAATIAGPASLISWVLAAAMLALLALVHAELGAAYPVAGGTARFPAFVFGPLAGFTAGWMAWLQAVTIAPIEVEATLSYSAHIGWVQDNITLLHPADATLTGPGIVVASVFMLIFTVINIVGVKLLANTNSIAVIWKTAIPALTIVVLLALSHHFGNFTAGGGFAPFGAHGVFAALPAGIVFSLQGFEQAIQMAGEARNPQKDVSRAVLTAMAIGTVVYLLLEVAFIAAINPKNVASNWLHPIGAGDFGPYATLAVAAGATWLAVLLYIDAVISPADTGLIYIGTASRLSYALGRQRAVPRFVAYVSSRGVPITSIIIAFVIGELSFLPFPSWQSLVGLVTSATAIMYAFAPVSLHALRLRDPDRERPYRVPAMLVTCPLAFISANLIIYWSSYQAEWKIGVATVIGLVLFALTYITTPVAQRKPLGLRGSMWVWPWFVGILIIGDFGRYGGNNTLPNWIDLIVVILFSLVIYYVAVTIAEPSEFVDRAVEEEKEEIASEPELNTA